MECKHDLAERETAVADGYCPICLRQQLADVQAENEALREVIVEVRGHILVGNWPSGTTDKHKLHKMLVDALTQDGRLDITHATE